MSDARLLPADCDRIVVDFAQRSVEAILGNAYLPSAGAPDDVWAFGIVRREIALGIGASMYLDGFDRIRRLRVHLDAPRGWRERLVAAATRSADELAVARQVERIVDWFDLPRTTIEVRAAVPPGSLEGRVAIVTGASRGIGSALAQRLAGAGATVVCVARTLDGHPAQTGELIDTSLADTVAAISARGGSSELMLADLGDPAVADLLIDRVLDRFGRLDIVVNNAARGMYRPVGKWHSSEVQKLFQVNVLSPFALMRTAIPHMRGRGFGAIVNVSSIVAEPPIGPPYGLFERRSFTTVYGMAKAALDRMSTGLAIECCDSGVQINSVSPSGGVRTPGALAASEMYNRRPEFAEPPETIAEAVLALCEPRTPMITGRVFTSGSLLADLQREVRALDGGPFADEATTVDLREACAQGDIDERSGR